MERPASSPIDRRMLGVSQSVEADAVIQLKRAYDPVAAKDGKRFLVERLWPRGMRKEALQLDGWMKDAAPSAELRKWFHADPARWPEFRHRYMAELEGNTEACSVLLESARRGTLTLLYAAHDTEHNSAVILKEFLEGKLAHRGPRKLFQSGAEISKRTRSKQ